MFISTILPPATVNPSTAKGCSPANVTTPGAPLTKAIAGGGEERVDEFPLLGDRRLGSGCRSETATSAAGELSRGRLGAIDDRGDLLERHVERVVENDRQPFCGGERVEHDQQSQADRVRDQRFVLGVDGVDRGDDRVGHVRADRLLASRGTGAQDVEADPSDDGREPRTQIVHLAGVGAAQTQPGLLDGVVCLAERAEHPVGDRP